MTELMHIIITKREIEAYGNVSSLAHAVQGLAMLGRGLGEFSIHTVSVTPDEQDEYYHLLEALADKRKSLRDNHHLMSRADIKSEGSNIIQLVDAIKAKIYHD